MQMLDGACVIGDRYYFFEAEKGVDENFVSGWYWDEVGARQSCTIVSGQMQDLIFYRHKWERMAVAFSLPNLIDFFSDNDVSYLVIDSVKGSAWSGAVHLVYRRVGWWQISSSRKLLLISYFREVLNLLQQIEVMHEEVIVSPELFLISDNKIRFHLLPDRLLWKPEAVWINRPFCYHLALMMIYCFTDFPPVLFDFSHLHRLRRSLLYFIVDNEVVELIVKSLNPDNVPGITLRDFSTCIWMFERRINSHRFLGNSFFLTSAFDFRVDMRALLKNFVSQIKACELKAGEPQTGTLAAINENSYLKCLFSNLFFLSYPASVTQHYHVHKESLPGNDYKYASLFDISSGDAGRCLEIFIKRLDAGRDAVCSDTNVFVNNLLANQMPDGSWPGLQPAPKSSATTFLNGVSGIAFVLWLRYAISGEESILLAANRAMDWLCAQSVNDGGEIYWLRTNEDIVLQPGFFEGVSGIAFCFIIAAQVTGNTKFREFAEKTLFALPDKIHLKCFDYANGLAGLGDVYITAWRFFGNTSWRTRAHAIAETLYYTARLNENDVLSWFNSTGNESGAFEDKIGILYFLSNFLDESGNAEHFLYPAALVGNYSGSL